jgi:hypothetical protein
MRRRDSAWSSAGSRADDGEGETSVAASERRIGRPAERRETRETSFQPIVVVRRCRACGSAFFRAADARAKEEVVMELVVLLIGSYLILLVASIVVGHTLAPALARACRRFRRR